MHFLDRTIKVFFVIFLFLNFLHIDLFGLLIITKRKRLSQITACHVMSILLFARNGPLCCQDTLLEQFILLAFTLLHSTMQSNVSVFISTLAFSKRVKKRIGHAYNKAKIFITEVSEGLRHG